FTPAAFKIEYPEQDPESWEQVHYEGSYFDWNTPKTIWVAEYYEVEQKKTTIHIFANKLLPDSEEQRFRDDELTDEKLEELLATGWE
ncbi:hypothetical protein LAJ57_13140, partial [Streptococcus pneumoniae]|uniref:portal protein n=1 Tax=Streptococcus pneumoniae TaxID=1313 RepID=UPI001CBDA67D